MFSGGHWESYRGPKEAGTIWKPKICHFDKPPFGPFWSEITQNVLPRISDKIIEMGLPNSSANVQCSSQHHSLACYYWGTQKCWCTGYTFTFKHVNPSKFDLSLWSCYSAKANCRPWTGRVWLKPFSDAWNLGRTYQVFLKQCCRIVLCQNAYCILWPYRRVHSARSAHRAHRAHRSMLVMVYPTVRVFERLGSQRLITLESIPWLSVWPPRIPNGGRF